MAKAKGTGSVVGGGENVGPVVTLALNKILRVEEENLRKFPASSKEIDGLAESIRQFGLFTPLLVKPLPELSEGENLWPGEVTHKLVAGYQRHKALLQVAGDQEDFEVPVHIAQPMGENAEDKVSSQFLNLEENVRRNELSYIDLGYAIQTMKDQGIAVKDIATRIGKTAAWISYVTGMLNLREALQKKIHDGTIPFRLARVLPTLDEAEQDKRVKALEDGAGGTEIAEGAVNSKKKKQKRKTKHDSEEAGTPEKKGLSAKKAVLLLGEVVGVLKEQEKLTKKEETLVTVFTLTAKLLEGKLGIKAYQNKVTELL